MSGTAIMWVQLLLSLSLLVILHELGHFIPAKVFKTRVEKFFMFFNPGFSIVRGKKLLNKWQFMFFSKGDEPYENDDPDVTEFGVGWLPLGGYVKISGMIDESMDKDQMAQPPQPWEFRSKSAIKRLIIMMGGVTVNFLLGVLIFGLMYTTYGEEYLPTENVTNGIIVDSLGTAMGLADGDKILKVGDKPFERFNDRAVILGLLIDDAETITIERDGQVQTITVPMEDISALAKPEMKDKSLFRPSYPTVVAQVNPGSLAEQAGLQVKDKIVAVNGDPIMDFDNFKTDLQALSGNEADLTVERGDSDILLHTAVSPEGTLGFLAQDPMEVLGTKRINYNIFTGLAKGFDRSINFISTQVKGFGQMFSGKIKAKDSLGGFGTFAQLYGKTWDWERFWNMTATVSILLAFFNLLPIPGLDGGYVMFLLFELATGVKPSDRFVERAVTVGFFILISLFIYANGLDIMRGFFN